MDIASILLNIGFIFNFIALAFREILWIRILLTLGYFLRFIYQYFFSGSIEASIWMIVFVSINLFQIIQIVNERRKRYIEPKIVDLYKTIFKEFTTYEFLHFWKIGSIKNVETGIRIINDGDYTNSIRLLLDGEVSILKSNKIITNLRRGHFIGEISYLTEEPAIADVMSSGPVSYIQWSNKQLSDMRINNKIFWIKLQNILLMDMIEKIKRGNN